MFMTGGGIALAATAHADDAVGCTIVVPANPLSATGLSTPYRLLAPCHEADPGTSAFVQATVVNPSTGQVAVYNPLVTDDGVDPAAAPVVPKLPAGAVVGIWFGFNGDNLTLQDTNGSLTDGDCVNGLGTSLFGQFAACNAAKFFSAANAAIGAGKLSVPALGTGRDGLPCPTTRDFRMVDQDQSDNVDTTYLFLPDGTTAQNTAANQADLAQKGAKVEVNGSDNGLLNNFIQPTLGCTPFTAPDLADPGKVLAALPLNELQAARQPAPVALIPPNDPMTLVDGRQSVRKTNLYREAVGQPPVDTATDTPVAYCQNMLSLGIGALKLDRDVTRPFRSPDSAAANSLFAFLAARLMGSFDELSCGDLMHIANPVHVIQDGDGVVVDATFDELAPASPNPAPSSGSPSSGNPSQSAGAPSQSPGNGPAPSQSASAAPSRSAAKASSTPPTRPAASPTPVKASPKPPTTPRAKPTTPAPTHPATHSTTTHPATHSTTTHPATAVTTPGSTGGGTVATKPADQSGADAQPSASGVAAAPVANPLPSLTLGPMPYKVASGHGAGVGGTGLGLPRLAGWSLLVGGGLIGIALALQSVAKRRRYRFADLDL